MKVILNAYDIFVFDLDGTILDTEPLHKKCWKDAFLKYNIPINLSMSKYEQMFHSTIPDNFLNHISEATKIDSPEEILQYKNNLYSQKLKTEKIKMFDFAKDIILFSIKNNKKFCIVTNTSTENLNLLKIKFELLNFADKCYTKNDVKKRKPHPECYLNVERDYPNLKLLGFEDSITGYHALSQVSSIVPILVSRNNYYWNEYIFKNYDVVQTLDNVVVN